MPVGEEPNNRRLRCLPMRSRDHEICRCAPLDTASDMILEGVVKTMVGELAEALGGLPHRSNGI